MATWLITGCSSGIGRALADAVLAHGDEAVVTARDPSTIADIAAAHPDTALAVALDVTRPDQIADAVQRAEARFGTIDVLVNNAGYGYRGAVEEGDAGDVQRLFDTHLFGAISTIKAVLPGMRARRSGAILNISSIGARYFPPGSGYYAAAKAALEALSGSLRKELAPLGISVTVVEPGGFRTDFAGRSLQQSGTVIDDYADTAGLRRKENDTATHGNQAGDPVKAAQALITAAESAEPPFLLLLGRDAVDVVRTALDTLRDDIDTWESLSVSTGFDTD